MWGSIDQKAVSEAKRLGHPEVASSHVAYCIAREFEKRGHEDLPMTSTALKPLLPRAGNHLGVPPVPVALDERLRTIQTDQDALDLLTEILREDWAASLTADQSASRVRDVASGDDTVSATETVAEVEDLDEVLAELDELVGLDVVKSRVRDLMATHKVNQVRIAQGKEPVPISLHLIFTGDPGTGKTTVARIVARIYRSLGLLERGHLVEVSRPDLVGQYVGQTAQQVKSVVGQAKGGVLFIDEAYSLAPTSDRDFGSEAIATLVKSMEDHRSNLAVIAAGYEEQMEIFIDSNPGLRSRFQTFIKFPDYGVTELLDIWVALAQSHDIGVGADVLDAVRQHLDSIRTEGQTGNARYVRGLFELMFTRLAARADEDGLIEHHEIDSFVVADVPDPSSSQLGKVRNRAGFL
jgi:SpoVK/Ycf46/Vps4 family AAA+-type ATPase